MITSQASFPVSYTDTRPSQRSNPGESVAGDKADGDEMAMRRDTDTVWRMQMTGQLGLFIVPAAGPIPVGFM